MSQMERAALDSVELEYEVSGTGEPVVLIHGLSSRTRSGRCWPSLAWRDSTSSSSTAAAATGAAAASNM
jgi:pimeloyl-ACP methyl ester carboxylesterase